MKKTLLLLLMSSMGVSFGQVTDGEKALKEARVDTLEGWKKGGYVSLSGSNVGLTNWAAGGLNSISFNGLAGGYANLTRNGWTWDNSLDLGYGVIKQGDAGWIKSDDKIDLTSKLGRRLTDKMYFAALANFRTQFTAGYGPADNVTEISGFLAPAYALGAVGIDFKPNDKLSLFVAPITTKMTIVNDDILANAGAFGVTGAEYDDLGALITPGKKFRAELGGYFRGQFKTKLTDNIAFTTKLDLFTNYIKNPGRIDVNWENLLEVKLWKFLSLTFATHLIYDDDIDFTFFDDAGLPTGGPGPRVQFKHVTGIGLSWKFDK